MPRILRLSSLLLAVSLACAAINPIAFASDAPDFATTLQRAEQGDADAQFSLGVMYANGEGVRQDDVTAVSWFTKAAEQGDTYAQSNLGTMYANGRGVRQDDVTAVSWFTKAAAQGDTYAQSNLGAM